MPHLLNTSKFTLRSAYGGVPYTFLPGEKKLIKNVRVINRRSGKDEDLHAEENIAAKLYGDLQPMGLVMIDDENPLTDAEYQRLGREAQIAFIRATIDEFNALNAEIASGAGRRLLPVPKHYQGLRDELRRLLKEEGEDEASAAGFTPEAELKEMQAEAARVRAAKGKDTEIDMAGDDAMIGENETGEIADPAEQHAANVSRRRGRGRGSRSRA